MPSFNESIDVHQISLMVRGHYVSSDVLPQIIPGVIPLMSNPPVFASGVVHGRYYNFIHLVSLLIYSLSHLISPPYFPLFPPAVEAVPCGDEMPSRSDGISVHPPSASRLPVLRHTPSSTATTSSSLQCPTLSNYCLSSQQGRKSCTSLPVPQVPLMLPPSLEVRARVLAGDLALSLFIEEISACTGSD